MSYLDQYTDVDGYAIEGFSDSDGFGLTATSDSGTEVSVYLSREYARKLAEWLLYETRGDD